MLLITGSFYVYARLNANLIYEQNQFTGRMLITPMILETHWKHFEQRDEIKPLIDELATSLKPEDLRGYQWNFYFTRRKPDESTKPGNSTTARAEDVRRPGSSAGWDAWELISRGQNEVIDIDRDAGKYTYYREVRAEQSCVTCHRDWSPNLQRGDLMGMAEVMFPLNSTEEALAWNNAVLLATAIVTAFLAMLAAYVIVRYVIVKPVLHLKDVSDEIARGTLDLRADIRTGDEFEELSHAFNRMLRHLTTVQDELRDANDNLGQKADELAQANLSLYETNKLKDEFLATMSHELRTPLNSILGFSDVLAGAKNLTDKQDRFVGNIQKSGHDLMTLINDLLDLAKIESGKMDVQPSEFIIGDVIERQVAALAVVAEKKNIALTTAVADDLPKIWQDSGKIQQVLNNLMSNAIKFTPEGGRVRVTARLADDIGVLEESPPSFEVVVEDTGVGIPLEDQETIFEKFRQGRSAPGQRDTMTREYGGTGLGLSIVMELTKLLGGEVTLESEFGKGSAFTVKLPIRYQADNTLSTHDPLQDSGLNLNRRLSNPPAEDTSQDEDAA
ncbi:ATP-binding protein [Thalassoroseus pseudoceratinae]|uniref:ATP-binding protein n=1 Tax=Thalassoroseus pseudoceratinae TaxID=2713176 RepID=UPI001F0E8C4A|nr:ATP-binding protein [Thalassoroseus pseudoceratinae]